MYNKFVFIKIKFLVNKNFFFYIKYYIKYI